jgi:hypothetical protein
MTLITLQDGKVVLRDGKVGTEQACCCEPPCECSRYSGSRLVHPDCEIDYISFDVEFVFPTCTGNIVQGTVVLTDTDGLNSGQAAIVVNNAAAGCDYNVRANLFCGSWSNASFSPDPFDIRWGLTVEVEGNTCCFFICDFFGSFSPQFPMGTETRNGQCCPAAISGTLIATEVNSGNQPCPGWEIRVKNMTVVLL